ncbi:glutamate-5-semialdehyde dehydrogenase [Dyadobacter sandarakinus]|uniref:Gamma-glutamyl phosphate reductase n=1 Tax=Dyadobacter sandarakinus TaxID=2747268 RepID=A0ABX7I8I2_9BACT|nr:glutamate-5-semialdehyde dehydrogenase [Dyadobacter sandarakinus]QRR02234.1 glutamate-5-semialdehyde dehydrogenase [Dyadobacter sandarakinus]
MDSILPILKETREASVAVRRLDDQQRADVLVKLAAVILANSDNIVTENQKDLALMDDADPKKDRLLLNTRRINDLAQSLMDVAGLPDPTRTIYLDKTIEQGMHLRKIAVPLGVVGVIYESRPNVTIDVAALCLRSGNACVLKGGKEAHYSNTYLVSLIHEALSDFGVPAAAVTLLPAGREYVGELLTATQFVDIIIPRGSESLIKFVRQNSLVPTIETGAGVCHTYVDRTADLDKAAEIVVNAKVSKPAACNALDTVLVDSDVAEVFLPKLKEGFEKWHVEVYADETSYAIMEKAGFALLNRAAADDFGREFLDFKCSVKVVADLYEALHHIEEFSSRHSEAIISNDQDAIDKFLNEVDAAAVYANASTRFTDGGVFALGAEIGISTQKLHARGPFALEKLVTEKWIVTGNGQVRW